MKAKDVVVSSSWVSFRYYWCILNIIFEFMKQLLVKNIFLLASTSHLIIAAIRNYLRAEKIKAFELLESREDQIKFLLDNKAQIALLQVNYNVIKNVYVTGWGTTVEGVGSSMPTTLQKVKIEWCGR